MFALFSVAFSSLFIAFGVAAVVGHVLLIDLLLRSSSTTLQATPAPMADVRLQPQPAR